VRVRSRGHELGQRGEVWGERVVEGGGEVAVEVVDVGWEDTLVDTEV